MAPKLMDIDVSALMPDPTQPRKTWVKSELDRVVDSIKARGLLQPIRVAWDDSRKAHLIITGESRWRAAVAAGLATIPCLVVEGGPLDEAELLADRITENACRHDLRPIEYAKALAKLKALKRWSGQQLAAELGISSSAVTRAAAVLTLSPDIQTMVEDGRVSESVAYDISRLENPERQWEMSQAVAAKLMNRDQVAAVVKESKGKGAAGKRPPPISGRFEGVGITLHTGKKVLEWDALLKAVDALRRKLKELRDGGSDAADANRLVKAVDGLSNG